MVVYTLYCHTCDMQTQGVYISELLNIVIKVQFNGSVVITREKVDFINFFGGIYSET